MSTLREYHEVLIKHLAQQALPVAPAGPNLTDADRAAFVEGYSMALADLRTTWQTNELWGKQVFCPDFLTHIGRIEATIERRLGPGEGAKTMTAGSGEPSP